MTDDPTQCKKPPSVSGVAFSLAGPGFHTGRPNRLELSVEGGGSGTVTCGGARRVVWGIGSRPEAVGRCTRSGSVGPLEHLSAAAIIHGVAGWHLEADHEDLPIFDGSARIWSLAFARLSDRAPVIEAPGSTLRAMGWKSERGGGIDVSPSDRFRMRVDWSDGPDGAEVWEGGTEELAGIVEARTFVNADDWIGARLAGLLKGADASSGRLMRGQNPSNDALVLARESGADPDSRVWIGGGTRMENECAAHKALDLVGDIGCWIGYLPKLSIHARDAGHDLHHLLGSALRGSIGEV